MHKTLAFLGSLVQPLLRLQGQWARTESRLALSPPVFSPRGTQDNRFFVSFLSFIGMNAGSLPALAPYLPFSTLAESPREEVHKQKEPPKL